MKVIFIAFIFLYSSNLISQVEMETLGFDRIRESESEGTVSFKESEVVLYVPVEWLETDVINQLEINDGKIEKYSKGWIYSAKVNCGFATEIVMNQRYIDDVVYNEINLFFAPGKLWKKYYTAIDTKEGSNQYKTLRFHFDFEYYKNGQLKSKLGFVEGKKSGLQEFYYENGQLGYSYNLKDGLIDGHFIGYHQDGIVKEKGNWISGEKTGIWISSIYSEGRSGGTSLSKTTKEYFPNGVTDNGGDGRPKREIPQGEGVAPSQKLEEWVLIKVEEFVDGKLVSCEGECD